MTRNAERVTGLKDSILDVVLMFLFGALGLVAIFFLVTAQVWMVPPEHQPKPRKKKESAPARPDESVE